MQQKSKIGVFVIIAFICRSAAHTEGPEREENSLIPKTLKPLDYNLLFEVDMADKKHLFLGTAVIRFECVEPTRNIILNMQDLYLDKNGVQVARETSNYKFEPIKTSEPMIDTERQWLAITLGEELKEKEKIQVTLEYYKFADTSLDPDAAFLKYSYSRKSDEKSKWIAVSTSGAVNGRRLYPCIDEPSVKTEVRMRVTHIHDENLRSISNTRIINDLIRENAIEDSEHLVSEPFEPTPSLSTFSIGFMVGDLKSKQYSDRESGIGIRVWSDEAVLEQMDLAGDTAEKIVNFYWKYFHSVHAIREIDVVAVPFYGRVDKWSYGLITIEESLITNENPSTQVRKIETAFTLCDVFCHQYFGPQTTFESWSDHWLNMGLALFYRIPCLEKIFPTQYTGIVNTHLVESFIRVSSVNAEIKSRPLMVPDSQIDLTKLFQDTALGETAYFQVRMMSYFLGKDVLTEQVRNYIANFRFQVTSLNEMWGKFTLGKDNGKLLSEDVTFQNIIDSWIRKGGIAQIKITRIQKEKFVTIRQEISTDSGEANPRIIPLNFITMNEAKEKFVIKNEAKKKSGGKTGTAKPLPRKNAEMKKSNEVTVQYWLQSEPITIPVEMNDWIILDTRLNVLCRVEYDPITLKFLRKTLLNEKTYEMIDVLSRTQFVSNLFASAEMGEHSYSMVFKFMSYLKHEKSHLPVMVALHELNRIRLALFGTEIFPTFEKHVREIIRVIIRRKKFSIGNISEDDYEQWHFKKLIFTSACNFRIKRYVNQSKTQFAKLLEDGNLSGKAASIPVVLREPFYCQAIKEGGSREWDFLIGFYNSEHWEYSNEIILSALSCTTDSDKLRNYLERSLDPEKIAPKDRLTVFQKVASNGNGYTIMMSFIRDNLKRIIELNERDPSQVDRYLEILYENTWLQQDLNELDHYLEFNVPLENIETRLKESKKVAQNNISWFKNMETGISNFFEEKKIGNRMKTVLNPLVKVNLKGKSL